LTDEVEHALEAVAGQVDVRRCRQVWLDATTTVWPAAPVWLHGDLDVGNVLVQDGRLSAVIDFGCCAVGDPACDLAPAWTLFSPPARRIFRDVLGLDVDTWRRARGWVLWKALVTLAGMSTPGSQRAPRARPGRGTRSPDSLTDSNHPLLVRVIHLLSDSYRADVRTAVTSRHAEENSSAAPRPVSVVKRSGSAVVMSGGPSWRLCGRPTPEVTWARCSGQGTRRGRRGP